MSWIIKLFVKSLGVTFFPVKDVLNFGLSICLNGGILIIEALTWAILSESWDWLMKYEECMCVVIYFFTFIINGIIRLISNLAQLVRRDETTYSNF